MAVIGEMLTSSAHVRSIIHTKNQILIVLGGLPGTGKTSIAREIVTRAPSAYLRIDTIEQALKRTGALQEVGSAGYLLAYELARSNLALGMTVVADCVNPLGVTREAWRAVAAGSHSRVLEVEIVCTRMKLSPTFSTAGAFPLWGKVGMGAGATRTACAPPAPTPSPPPAAEGATSALVSCVAEGVQRHGALTWRSTDGEWKSGGLTFRTSLRRPGRRYSIMNTRLGPQPASSLIRHS